MPDVVSLADKVVDENSPFFAALYGRAGTGKTTFLASVPKPLLIFDFNGKLKPLYGVEGIDVISYSMESLTDAAIVFSKFYKDWKGLRKGKWGKEYKSIALDDMTSFDTLALQNFCILGGKDPELEHATLPIYMDQSGWYQSFLFQLQGIQDKFIFMLFHEYYRVDGESNIHSIQPLLTGAKILEKIPGAVEELWHFIREKDEYYLDYRAFKKADAGSTIMNGAGRIKNPTFQKVMEEAKKTKKKGGE